MRRPDVFTLDYSHPLAQGLVFAGLGDTPSGARYNNIALPRTTMALNPACHFWTYDEELGRNVIDSRAVAGQAGHIVVGTLPPITGANTFVFWSKHYAASDASGFVIWGQPTGFYWQHFTSTRWNIQTSSVYFTDKPIEIQSDKWRCWACVSNGAGVSGQSLYLNGSLHATGAGINGALSPSAPWRFMSWTATDSKWQHKGLVADPLFFNRALSPSEIALLADRTDPMLGGLIVEERPVLYFDMGGSTNINGPLAITTDSSLGLGGVRGAKGAVFVSHLYGIEASGVKQAKGATTFLDSAQFVCAGVLEESDDKIGPAVFVNESAVGIGGIKKIFASFGISHASDFGVGGTSGVLMPELSQASGAAISSSEISGSVYTNKNTGTLYAVATLSSTKPSVAQIQAGQNHLGASAAYATSQDITTYGTQSVLADSLSSYTQYYWHFQHKDAEYLDSTVITSSAIRTLDISIPLTFSDTAPATLLTVQVWSKVPKKADVEGLY